MTGIEISNYDKNYEVFVDVEKKVNFFKMAK